MTSLVKFPLEGGDSVIVEVDEKSGPVPAASPGELAGTAAMGFEKAVAHLRPVSTAILAQVRDLGPQDVTVELSVKFSAEAGVILAKTAGEGTCKITLAWKGAAKGS